MTLARIPPSSFAIPCFFPNCQKCHCFDTSTLSKIGLSTDDIRWSMANSRTVDLFWDSAPSRFRNISAYIKMKKHMLDHVAQDLQQCPPLINSTSLEQQQRAQQRLHKIANRNNSSARDLPPPYGPPKRIQYHEL
jgi:hypothetical protein